MDDSTKKSKFLSFVLRHNPAAIGIELDSAGWTDVTVLLQKINENNKRWGLSLEELQEIVDQDSKQRYSMRDGRIRANQGHSLKNINAIDNSPVSPPDRLYHGTTVERWERIQKSGGLKPMKRHHVHLSDNLETAWAVASRHRRETPIILVVDAAAMSKDKYDFFKSENEVWLVDSVPCSYIQEHNR